MRGHDERGMVAMVAFVRKMDTTAHSDERDEDTSGVRTERASSMQDAFEDKTQETQPLPQLDRPDSETHEPSTAPVEAATPWIDDFEGLDEIDIASALSFPASDPPSLSARRTASESGKLGRR
jgi:hypothetical protein